MRLLTADGQVFDAWVNSPENDRKIPRWLGQIGHTTETHTTIQAPDGSQLTIGAGDVVVNEHGRLVAMSMRNARRLFDIEEGEEELQGPQSISVPAQTLQVGRPRQGMVTADRRRLQPDNSLSGQVQDQGGSSATAASDSGAPSSEQDGESAGESTASDPTQATATGGPGGEGGDDPAFGATGDGGGEVAAGDQDEASGEAGEPEDSGEEVKPRRRSRK